MDSDDQQAKKQSDSSWRQALATTGLALSLPWTIAVPVYVGWRLDQWLGTWPLCFIVAMIAGLGGAAVDTYALLKRFRQFK